MFQVRVSDECPSTAARARSPVAPPLDARPFTTFRSAGAQVCARSASENLWRPSPLLLRNRLVVVGGIELGAIGAPGTLLNGAVDLAQPGGRHAQGYDLADSHHDVPRHDLDALGGKLLEIVLALELLVDLIERFALIMF